MAAVLNSAGSDVFDEQPPVAAASNDGQPDQSPSDQPASPNRSEHQPVVYHHLFTAGNIELAASDDIRFRFDVSILQQHSGVFRDMADLPQPAGAVGAIPFLNASALTLEILLCALDPAKDVRPDPSAPVLQQLCGLIDAYDISLRDNDISDAVELSGLSACHKYRFASSHNPEMRQYRGLECLNEEFFSSRRMKDIKLLFAEWENALEEFWELFVTRPVTGKDCFNNKCWSSYCPTFAAFRGQWRNAKSDVADALHQALKRAPPSAGEDVLESFIDGRILCSRCNKRFTKHAMWIWNRVVAQGLWVP